MATVTELYQAVREIWDRNSRASDLLYNTSYRPHRDKEGANRAKDRHGASSF